MERLKRNWKTEIWDKKLLKILLKHNNDNGVMNEARRKLKKQRQIYKKNIEKLKIEIN